MKPFFSIIIPTYNVAPWIRECLDSVLAAAKTLNDELRMRNDECWRSVEIICVDDGSTDGSGEILDGWEREKKIGGENRWRERWVVIHQPNGGEGAARNAALAVASGEWVLFVDADDVIAPGMLVGLERIIRTGLDAQLLAFASKDFADGASVSLDGDGETEMRMVDISQRVPSERLAVGFWCNAYRRDLIGDVRFQDYTRGADLVFLTQVIDKTQTVLITDQVWYGYRQRMNSAVHGRQSARMLRDRINASAAVVKLMLKSSKCFPFRVYRTYGLRLMVIHPWCILHRPWREQALLWLVWLVALGSIALLLPVGIFQRIVYGI